MVFQNYALWPHLSALDTVAYPGRRRGMSRAQARQEAMVILERLHVSHLADRRPAELSGGEQQRVGLGRALARDAALYLFDEPTAHLDMHVRAVFVEELLTRLRDTGAAAMYATHDAEEALGVADRVVLLADGRVVQVGTPEEVYHRPVDLWAARLTGPASVLAGPTGPLLVRPGWARLEGRRTGAGGGRAVPGAALGLPAGDRRRQVAGPRARYAAPRAGRAGGMDAHRVLAPRRPGRGDSAVEQRRRAGVKVALVHDPQVAHRVGPEAAHLLLAQPVAHPLPVQGHPVPGVECAHHPHAVE